MKASIREICDRQDLIEGMKLRKLGIDPYMMDRLDMYWIEVRAGKGKDITYSVDPTGTFTDSGTKGWTLTRQYGGRDENDHTLEEMRRCAEEFFSGSEYEKKMQGWVKNLADASYFEEGRFPGKNSNPCPHCKSYYEIGTSHEHIDFDGRVVAHSGRKYQEALKLGLKPTWRPGCDAQTPSLEEKGILKKAVIPPKEPKENDEPDKSAKTVLITPKKKLYIFSFYSYDSVNVVKIVLAASEAECIGKVMANYDDFDELFKDNLLGQWFYGGLFEFCQLQQDAKKRSQDAECWTTEEAKKIQFDKDYRRKLVEKHKDTMFSWIEAYYKDSEGSGISVTECDTFAVIE